MHRRTFAIFISMLVAAVVAAGCGDDESESLTKAEFIKQADAVCKEANEEKQKRFKKFTTELEQGDRNASPSTEQEVIEVAVIPALEEQTQALEDLDAPAGNEEQVKKIRNEFESVLTEAKENPVGSEVASAPFEDLSTMTSKYGFNDCGQP